MVTLYLLGNLARECGTDWEKFEHESRIENIAKVQVAENVNKQHYLRVAQKIKRFLI